MLYTLSAHCILYLRKWQVASQLIQTGHALLPHSINILCHSCSETRESLVEQQFAVISPSLIDRVRLHQEGTDRVRGIPCYKVCCARLFKVFLDL